MSQPFLERYRDMVPAGWRAFRCGIRFEVMQHRHVLSQHLPVIECSAGTEPLGLIVTNSTPSAARELSTLRHTQNGTRGLAQRDVEAIERPREICTVSLVLLLVRKGHANVAPSNGQGVRLAGRGQPGPT